MKEADLRGAVAASPHIVSNVSMSWRTLEAICPEVARECMAAWGVAPAAVVVVDGDISPLRDEKIEEVA